MITKELKFSLPEPLIEPTVIESFFTEEMFNNVKQKINSIGMSEESNHKYHTMIGRWESPVLFSKDIEDFCLQRAREIFNDETLLKAYFFTVKYQIKDGCVPHLWEHTDQNGTQTTVDLTIENTADWDITVEGVNYKQKPNDAVVFCGQQHMHARPPYPTEDESAFTTVLFMHFTRPDHWIQTEKGGLNKYGSDGDIRFFNRNRYLPLPDAPIDQPVCPCHNYASVLELYDSICGDHVDEPTELVDISIVDKQTLAPGIVCYTTTKEAARTLKGLTQNSCFKLWEEAEILSKNREPAISYSARSCYIKFINEQTLKCHPQDPLRRLYESLTAGTDKIIEDYSKEYSTGSLKSKHWQLTRYEKGGRFHNHVDDCVEFPRVVSLSFVLNDDYEGGDLVFKNFGVTAPKKAGSIIVFGSSYPYMHEVTPVTRGIRYAAVRWYNYIGTDYNGV
jgi:hypothetical protein